MRSVLHLSPNWTAGEIPIPLLVQLLTPPQSLQSWNLQVRFERDGVELTPQAGTPVEWEDITLALAKVNFAAGDIEVTAGAAFSRYEIEVWAAGAGQRIASKTIINEVYPQVGAAPTVT